jgi:hypothetical protein
VVRPSVAYALLCLAVGFLLLVKVLQTLRGRAVSVQDLKDWYITAVVVVLFTLHPNLTQHTFLMFACKKIGANRDDLFLLADLSERCFTPEHFKWIFTVAVPCLALYVVGIPLLAYKLLRRNSQQLTEQRVVKKYSFLYKGYELQWYFWEVVVVARKVGLAAIAVFFSYNAQIQSLMAVLLVMSALLAHVYARPFESDLMDMTEFFSLTTSFATFWAGQFLFVPDLPSGDRVFLSVLIVGFNIGFIIFSAVILVKVLKQNKRDRELQKLKKGEAEAGAEAGQEQQQRETALDTASPSEPHLDKPTLPKEEEDEQLRRAMNDAMNAAIQQAVQAALRERQGSAVAAQHRPEIEVPPLNAPAEVEPEQPASPASPSSAPSEHARFLVAAQPSSPRAGDEAGQGGEPNSPYSYSQEPASPYGASR